MRTLSRSAPGQSDNLPGQTGDNAGVAGFVCPDCAAILGLGLIIRQSCKGPANSYLMLNVLYNAQKKYKFVLVDIIHMNDHPRSDRPQAGTVLRCRK